MACPTPISRTAGLEAALGRVVLAHLGRGASLAAASGGTSIDTTIVFTPTSGLVMSTRTGDLDPGLVSFLARTEQMTAPQFHQMINHESGLLGVSEISSDMRTGGGHRSAGAPRQVFELRAQSHQLGDQEVPWPDAHDGPAGSTPRGSRMCRSEQVPVGDRLRVPPGERVPVDGVVIEGTTTVDESV